MIIICHFVFSTWSFRSLKEQVEKTKCLKYIFLFLLKTQLSSYLLVFSYLSHFRANFTTSFILYSKLAVGTSDFVRDRHPCKLIIRIWPQYVCLIFSDDIGEILLSRKENLTLEMHCHCLIKT